MKHNSNLKLIRRNMAKENAKRSELLEPIDRKNWPHDDEISRIAVLISRRFLVQVFQHTNEIIRLSCNRTSLDQFGNWEENLSWEELMEIKRQAGYGNAYAVEVLPEDQNIINVANMRHIWIIPQPIVGWRKPGEESRIISLNSERG
jgi:hypothetical protein